MRVVLLGLVACSEYDIGAPLELDPGTALTTPAAICEAGSAPAIEVPLEDSCEVEIQTGTFNPSTEWAVQGHNGYGPPVVGQLDDDNGDGRIDAHDTPDIAYISNTGEGVVFVNGKTGAIQGIVNIGSDGVEGLAIGDLEGDGIPEVVAAASATRIVVLDNRGVVKWEANVDSGGLFDFLYPAIADMDGDGLSEVIAGRTILAFDGTLLGSGTKGVGAVPNQSGYYVEGAVSVPVDLDGDGLLEVVTGNAAYNIDGSIKYSNNLPDGCPAVADFDGDGEPEIFAVSGNTVFALESDLTPTGWYATFPNTNYIGPPAADDLDGDGLPEVVVVGSGEMRAYDWSGEMKWSVPVQDLSGAAGPILFDFERDGYPEVVYADEEFVRVYNGLDGSVKLVSGDHSSATGFETPVVADVDADGEVEIVLLHGGGSSGLTVFGDEAHSWPSGRQVWNQHAYSITNVNDDLTLPAQEPNWERYNNFRSGDAGLPPNAWNELKVEIVSVCREECPGSLRIVARVWNEGTFAVAAGVPLVVRGASGEVLVTQVIDVEIPSGWSSEGVELVVPTSPLLGKLPVVAIDDGAGLWTSAECDATDNAEEANGC